MRKEKPVPASKRKDGTEGQYGEDIERVKEKRNGRLVGAAETSKELAEWRECQTGSECDQIAERRIQESGKRKMR